MHKAPDVAPGSQREAFLLAQKLSRASHRLAEAQAAVARGRNDPAATQELRRAETAVKAICTALLPS